MSALGRFQKSNINTTWACFWLMREPILAITKWQLCGAVSTGRYLPTYACKAWVEKLICETPHQYQWTYKCFKRRPEGEKSLY